MVRLHPRGEYWRLCQRRARLSGCGALFQLGINKGLSCHNLGPLTEVSAKFVVTFAKNRAILISTYQRGVTVFRLSITE